MNLLFVADNYPWPLDTGGVHRVYHLVDALSRKHQVTLVTIQWARPNAVAPGEPPLFARCARVIHVSLPVRECIWGDPWAPVHQRLWSLVSSVLPGIVRDWTFPELVAVLRGLKESTHFDAAWVTRSFIAENARKAGFENCVLDVDNIESVSLLRMLRHSGHYLSKPLRYAEWLKLFVYERALPRRFWRLVVCKPEDRNFFGRRRHQVFVVPNGVIELPPAPASAEAPDEILFVGTLEYLPNIDAALHFYHEVFPEIVRRRPGARFVVVGKNAVPDVLALHNGTSCVVASSVPDVAPYFEAASLVVVPMRGGGGTRLKVLEALARGKAVVSTSVGAEGLDLRPGIDLEIADRPASFARACVRLLGDADTRRRLGAAGRQRVLERYRWDAIGTMAERVLSPDSAAKIPHGSSPVVSGEAQFGADRGGAT